MCDVILRPIVGGVPAENRAEVVSKARVVCVGRSSVATQTDGVERESTWLSAVDQDRNLNFRDPEQHDDRFQLDFVPYRGLTRHNAKYVIVMRSK